LAQLIQGIERASLRFSYGKRLLVPSALVSFNPRGFFSMKSRLIVFFPRTVFSASRTAWLVLSPKAKGALGQSEFPFGVLSAVLTWTLGDLE